MGKCAYCSNGATTMDAVGLPACEEHKAGADEYFERQTGRKPDDDTFLYCDKHSDLWKPGCSRCEQCSQYHYDRSVAEMQIDPNFKVKVYNMP